MLPFLRTNSWIYCKLVVAKNALNITVNLYLLGKEFVSTGWISHRFFQKQYKNMSDGLILKLTPVLKRKIRNTSIFTNLFFYCVVKSRGAVLLLGSRAHIVRAPKYE